MLNLKRKKLLSIEPKKEEVKCSLKSKLVFDLKSVIGLDFAGNFILDLRDYSKSYNGLYYPNDSKIVVYVYKDPEKTFLVEYSKLFKTFLHEYTHHWQYTKTKYTRVRGVMHNEAFWQKYNYLISKAEFMNIL